MIHGTDGRTALTHKRLAAFMKSEFDLTPWGVGVGDRAAVVLPNGPEVGRPPLSRRAAGRC